ESRAALPDPVADRAARHDEVTLPVEMVALEHVCIALRVHGFRPRLDDEQLAALAVLRPFHIHGRRRTMDGCVVLLHYACPSGKLDDLVVAEYVTCAIRWRNGLAARQPAATYLVDELRFLAADTLAQHGSEALLQGRLEDRVLVAIHRALNHAFA